MNSIETTQKRIGRLQVLCNKYGDFKAAIAGKNEKTGESFWSKHRSVLECWESEEGIYFLAQANNRQILPNEIVIDLDNNPTIEEFNHTCNKLEGKKTLYEGYHTGSRGYHIHIWDNKLANYPKREREELRKILIKYLDADPMKANEVMIALENALHWKTGKLKTKLRGNTTWD